MTKPEVDGYMSNVDFLIREASGGWIVLAPLSWDEEAGGYSSGLSIFGDVESALEYLRQRMIWFKTERNKGSFDKGDDDYEGTGPADVIPPTLTQGKP